MSEKPNCFGYVLSTREWLKEHLGIEPVKDCKDCDLLEDCTKEYNERTYNEWCWQQEDEVLELENPGYDVFLDDYDGWPHPEDDPE